MISLKLMPFRPAYAFGSLREYLTWMRMPTIYTAESVRDFGENRNGLKHSLVQRLFQDPIMPDYAIVTLHDVRLRHHRDPEGLMVQARNQRDEVSWVFELYDDSSKCMVYWPPRPHATIGFSDARISQGLQEDDPVSFLMLFHDLNYHNSFVNYVKKENSCAERPRGPRGKKRLHEILSELGRPSELAEALER